MSGVEQRGPIQMRVASGIVRVEHVERGSSAEEIDITLDERVYDGLHQIIGRRRISQFIETLVRPHVLSNELEEAYRAMAADEQREAEALAWAEGTILDSADDPR